jgi:putative PEP-CTERM system histidine kinase
VTPLASGLLHAGAAAACALWALLILLSAPRRLTLAPALYALALSAWAGAVALLPDAPVGGLIELLPSAAAIGLLASLAARLGGPDARPIARRIALAGGGCLLLVVLAGLLPPGRLPLVAEAAAMARIALALFLVVVAENIARNADEARRWHAILPCIAVGGVAAFDLLLYAAAVLNGAFSAELVNARAVLAALVPALLWLAARRDRRWRRPPAVSRSVVFHAATLLVAGAFLIGVGAAGEALRWLNAEWGGSAQLGLLAGAVMALAVALSSRSFRSWLRRLIVDHFFAARYDYRAEWLRCAATLAAGDATAPPAQRAIRAVADAMDVPAGALLLRPHGEEGLRWGGSWNLAAAPLSLPPEHPLVRRLEAGEGPILLEGPDASAVEAIYGPLWLAVPLPHDREGLTGAVLLARPRAPFPLDEEVTGLLGALGREVALFLAEREAAERLADSRKLAEYAKRFAFVAHDVKTVSNQLQLILANADAHMADPEFQRDLLTTVRASADRINTLIARLRQEDAAAEARGVAAPEPVGFPVMERLAALARTRAGTVALNREGGEGALPLVAMPPESFDAAVTHLLDNAAEASPPGEPVLLVVRPGRDALEIDIIDRGPGMSAEFVRDHLFRPLATSKPGGSGIGAWQARDLLTRAGGSLSVLTTPGEGTTMRLSLPVRAAA